MPVPVSRSPFERAAAEELVARSNVDSNIKRVGSTVLVSADWIETFLSLVMQGSSVTDATSQCGIHITLPYKRRTTDEAFKSAWKEAAEIGTEFLEHEAARRAYHGTLEPVFYKGEQCGTIRRYSDTLLMFLLKGRRPEVYREGVEDGAGRGNITLNVQVVEHQVVGVDAPTTAGVSSQGEGGAPILVEVVPSGASHK